MKIDPSKLRALVKERGLSNTSLAALAGITRQALQSMLRGGRGVEVRERTVKGLTRALRLPDESSLSPDPLVGYKEAVAAEQADLTFRGLGLPTTEPRSMDDLYVPIRVVPEHQREIDHECEPPPVEAEDSPIDVCDPLTVEETVPVRARRNPIDVSDPLTFEQCLARQPRVLIRGEPGSGKTTALRHAAGASARGVVLEGQSSKRPRTPLMVRLADFAKARERDGQVTLVRFVVTSTLRDASPEYWAQVERHLESELARGACLVLLDGLDEVGGNPEFFALLRAFVDRHGQNQFVLTSRIVGLDAGPWRKLDFAMFQVARWDEGDIQAFARRWYAGRPTAGRKPRKRHIDIRAEELATAILSHPPLREIAGNPLMLTILAALHYANATLPRRRVDLYAKIVEVMLETWESSKRDARPGDPLHGIVLEAREFAWLLARLALEMQREGRTLLPRYAVSDTVQQFLREHQILDGEQAKEQSDRVVRYLCERTGLLVERGDDVFGFSHRTFQEYFATRGLLLQGEDGEDIVTLLRPYLFHPQWEEVVVLVAASLPSHRATALVRVLLDDPEPAGRFLRRGQRLALRCLADGAAVADRALLDQVFSQGAEIGAFKWVGIPLGIIDLLKQLQATRHAAEAKRMLADLVEGAKQKQSDYGYLAVYWIAHGLPDGPRKGTPGMICKKRLGGRSVELVWPDREKRLADPEAWYDEVLGAVRDPEADLKRRLILLSILGEELRSRDEARRPLSDLLVQDPLPAIRAACAEALTAAGSRHPPLASLFLARLDEDSSDVVQERCAEALRGFVADQTEVREHLEAAFASGPARVRAGAANGLSGLDLAAPDQHDLLQRFLATVADADEPPRVRAACLWAVASVVGQDGCAEVDRLVERHVDDPEPTVSKVALHVLADAIAEGRGEWLAPLVERVETKLMTAPDPCPHFYLDLAVIVALKEVHGGRRLDRLLGDALAPLADRIAIAFVFGSVARQEQVAASDIDLMVIGEVRLKEVAVALHSAEQTLGRSINPVLFSPEKFREQYREGNPLLLDVVRKEKLFLKGSRDELTNLVADRSPG